VEDYHPGEEAADPRRFMFHCYDVHLARGEGTRFRPSEGIAEVTVLSMKSS
jgi:hypothetical protein